MIEAHGWDGARDKDGLVHGASPLSYRHSFLVSMQVSLNIFIYFRLHAVVFDIQSSSGEMSTHCQDSECHHAPVAHGETANDPEKNKVIDKPYKCGECSERFSAVCVLHHHLKGESYRYEADCMTAFPVNRSTCSAECKLEEPDKQDSAEKYYKVYKMHKRKRSSEHSGLLNIIKIIDNAEQEMQTEDLAKADPVTVADENDISGETEPAHCVEQADRALKTRVNICDILEYANYSRQPETAGNSDESNEEQMYKQCHSLERKTDEGSQEFVKDASTVESEDPEQSVISSTIVVEPITDDVETVSSDIPAQTVYYELDTLKVEDNLQVQIDSGAVKYASPTEKHKEIGLCDKGLYENVDIHASIIENISGTADDDVDLGQAVAAFDKINVPQSGNKQVIVTVYGIETNEDGTMQVIVGEKDASVFNTPAGDEIVKALKAQAKNIPSSGCIQVVFSNSDCDADLSQNSNIQTRNFEGSSVSLGGCDVSDEADQVPTKRHKRNEKDVSSLPNFEIQFLRPNLKYAEIKELGDKSTGELKPIAAIVFKNSQEKLSTADALNILTECNLGMHSDKISKIQPEKAKGGEVYVVDLDALPHKKDCRYDRYLWVNCVTRKFPRKNPILNKHVFKIRLPNNQFSDAFQRHIYQFIEEARYCIIHYIGYESVFQPLAHGNSKTGAVFNRTCPSVLRELKELSKGEGVTPNKIYRHIETLEVPDNIKGFRTPRNLSQIKNTFSYARRTKEKHKKECIETVFNQSQ